MKRHIYSRLCVVYLKLQEFERKATGAVSDRFKSPYNFVPFCSRGQSPVLVRRRITHAKSLSQMEQPTCTVSQHSASLMSLPSTFEKPNLDDNFKENVTGVSCVDSTFFPQLICLIIWLICEFNDYNDIIW